MLNLILLLLKYFISWLLMCAILFAALLAEGICPLLFDQRMRAQGLLSSLRRMRYILHSVVNRIVLPEAACAPLAIYCPGVAFAALIPICASIPFASLIPILDNGGDLMQILMFAMFSETFAALSVLSLGTSCGNITAHRIARELISIILPMTACFSSLAAFFAVAGLQGDTFSLNAFTLSVYFDTLGAPGIAGIAIFIFVIFNQIPHSKAGSGCALFEAGELSEYQGCPREILQLWSIFRGFIIVALVTHVFFPWGYFKNLNAGFSISWWAQAVNFFAFWTIVILVRIFGVTLCWKIREFLEKRLSRRLDSFLIPSLTIAAMALIIYESVKMSMEVAAF